MSDIVLWKPQAEAIVPPSASTAQDITACARQLSRRDVEQIVRAYEAGSYEMVSTFVWAKAIAALKEQLTILGSEFIAEMLGRPDIAEGGPISSAITDHDAIKLAQELGMIGATDAMRLQRSMETISHFASNRQSEEESMAADEALGCMRACIQGVLGYPKLGAAIGFTEFRKALESRQFKEDDREVVRLVESSYFFQRTTLSVLLALTKTAEGAQLDHALGNINTILPLLWPNIRKTERWQVGNTYAEVSAAGRKTAVVGLRKALIRVHGFDFVPEDLRSKTFTRAARLVLQAHEGVDNFYNEPAPLHGLASLGTTIPMPAFAACMTAILCCYLGNYYGHSRAAEAPALQILESLSVDKWEYYLNECLPGDTRILYKLTQDKPRRRWFALAASRGLTECNVTRPAVEKLMRATKSNNSAGVQKSADEMSKELGYST
ncbi:hypothetical protein [Sorangium sp. So ce1097]|uniref:hypothetical protein n=1 Tax=Sorangium sp. So ce1097 TaxID=3133330 RepID=UPI003F5E6C3A